MGYLVTPGAAGTWALAEVGGLALKNGDPSFNPHTRDTSSVSPDARVAYVYSNAFDTILSFWRRGFMRDPTHAGHLGVVGFDPCDCYTGLAEWLRSLSCDPFGLAGHMIAWAGRPNTAFVKYEALFHEKIVKRLAGWIDADLSAFEFKPRESCWYDAFPPVLSQLSRVYGDLFANQYHAPVFVEQ